MNGKNLKVLSLNINGQLYKLEWTTCIHYLNKFDIVCLNELKCEYPFCVAGFRCIRSKIVTGDNKRGGVAVLVKETLWSYLYSVNAYRDQIWFKLSIFPEYLFGSCYIPPRDSPFFSPESFSIIQENISGSADKIVLMGDLNSRITDLSVFNLPECNVSYSRNEDLGSNRNGRDLVNLCLSFHLRPVNHLQSPLNLDGKLTYKQGERWISQLDWVLISNEVIKDITEFSIDQHCPFNTNHAALCFSVKIHSISYRYLYNRALLLDCYKDGTTKRAKGNVSMSSIDKSRFTQNLPPVDIFWNTEDPSLYHTLTTTLYDTCRASMITSHGHDDQNFEVS